MPQSQQDLREMVYHTDARVTAMEGQISTIGQNQLRSEQKIDNLITYLNQPKHINWAAWVGVGLTAIIMMVGGLFGVAQYVALVNEPQIQDIHYNRDQMQDYRAFQREMHYEVGRTVENEQHFQSEIDKLWDHIHALEEADKDVYKEIRELIDRIARWEVGSKATGNYAQELSDRLDRLKNVVRDFQNEAQYIHGQREELGRRVDDIDNLGSRRWNRGQPDD